MNDLDPDTDAPLLRMLVDIMIDQHANDKLHMSLPTSAKPHVVALVAQRAGGLYAALSSNSAAEQCAAYHFHGADEACYESYIDVPPTSELIAQFYAHITSAPSPIYPATPVATPPRAPGSGNTDSRFNGLTSRKSQSLARWPSWRRPAVSRSASSCGMCATTTRRLWITRSGSSTWRGSALRVIVGDCGDCEHEEEREGNLVINLLPAGAMAEARGMSDGE
jgi:hypothetical protein